MRTLKFHPREALPNVTALARADALHVELTGERRQMLAQVAQYFRAALETQDPSKIEPARQSLLDLMADLKERLRHL
jgi:molecular chaperone HscC